CAIDTLSLHDALPIYVQAQTEWIHQRLRVTVKNGKELFDRLDDFFPHLVFCDAVEDQMNALPSQSIASIVRGLFHLNSYCVTWIDRKSTRLNSSHQII